MSSAGTVSALDITLPNETATYKPSEHPGYALTLHKCLICHSAEYAAYQPPTSARAYWKNTVLRMRKPFGAPVTDQEAETITDYLVKTYGAERKGN